MKNKIYSLMIVALVVLTSCGDYEPVIYNPDTDQVFTFFSDTSVDLEVVINESASIDVEVGVSTLSDSDRTINITVDMDNSSASAGQYSVPSTVTIPANSYFGTFTVTGIDDGLTTEGVALVLLLSAEGIPNTAASTTGLTVNIKEICPVDESFAVGDYTLTFVSGGIAAAGFAPALGTDNTVTLEVGTSSTLRQFNVKFYPSFGFSNPPVDVGFALSCEATIFNGILDGVSGVGCGGSIAFGSGESNGSYSAEDDETITLVMTEDTEEICGSSAQTIYTLTKN